MKTNKFRGEKDTNTIRLWRRIEKEYSIRCKTDFSDLTGDLTIIMMRQPHETSKDKKLDKATANER